MLSVYKYKMRKYTVHTCEKLACTHTPTCCDLLRDIWEKESTTCDWVFKNTFTISQNGFAFGKGYPKGPGKKFDDRWTAIICKSVLKYRKPHKCGNCRIFLTWTTFKEGLIHWRRHFQNLSSTMPWLSRQTLSEEFYWKQVGWVLVENVPLCRRLSIAWVWVRQCICLKNFKKLTEIFRNAIKKNHLWFPSQDSIGVEGGNRSWLSYEPRQWERGVLSKINHLYFIIWPCLIRLVK